MAESFVDTFKTELIKDRTWETRSQVELAILEYVDWFNNRRLHESLGDIPPVEFEQHHTETNTFPGEVSVAGLSPSASERLTTPRSDHDHTKIALNSPDPDATEPSAVKNGLEKEPMPAKTAQKQTTGQSTQLVSLAETLSTTTNTLKTY